MPATFSLIVKSCRRIYVNFNATDIRSRFFFFYDDVVEKKNAERRKIFYSAAKKGGKNKRRIKCSIHNNSFEISRENSLRGEWSRRTAGEVGLSLSLSLSLLRIFKMTIVVDEGTGRVLLCDAKEDSDGEKAEWNP